MKMGRAWQKIRMHHKVQDRRASPLRRSYKKQRRTSEIESIITLKMLIQTKKQRMIREVSARLLLAKILPVMKSRVMGQGCSCHIHMRSMTPYPSITYSPYLPLHERYR
jgi:hypothetical protein